MSKTLAQIFALNPAATVNDTDLFYLVQSPYTPGTDAGISGATLKSIFGTGGTVNPGLINQLGYYAAAGSAISGLATANNGILITSSGGVPSISSTLPNAVQGNITSVGTIASGTWNGGIINGIYGGTGVNNGASTITVGGNFAMSGAFAFTGTLTNTTAVTFPTSGTLATTAQLLSSPLTTKGDIWVFSTVNTRLAVGATNGQILQVSSGAATGLAYSTPTYPSASGTAGTILRSDGTNNVYSTFTISNTFSINNILYASAANSIAGLATANNGLLVTSATGVPSILAGPGTTGNILQSNAAAAPSFSTATYPSLATVTGTLLRADGTNWSATTSTYPNTNAINTLLYASAANVMSALSTANNSGLLTNSSGVPSWVTVTGTGAPVLATSPTITTPIIAQINDVNGFEVFSTSAAGTPVNSIEVFNANTGVNPGFIVIGSDTNAGMTLETKGTGSFSFNSAATSAQFNFVMGATPVTNTFSFPVTTGYSYTWPAASGTVGITSTGTWTPIDASGASLSFSTATGTYIQIGNIVIATAQVVYPSTVNGSAAIIGGLPVVTGSTNQKMGGSVVKTTVSTLAHATTLTSNTAFSLFTTAGVGVLNSAMSLSTNTFQLIYFI
jgi:hypothetical protein